MSNTEKQEKSTTTPVVSTVVTTPPIPEVVGMETALTGIDAAKVRLTTAINAVLQSEKEVEKFRAELNAMPAGLNKSFLISHQGEIESEHSQNTKRAVSDVLAEVKTHISSVQQLADQIQAKHGKPVETVATRDKKGTGGDITSGNMDNLRAVLNDRGFAGIEFHLQSNGKYEVNAVKANKAYHTVYASNVRADWH